MAARDITINLKGDRFAGAFIQSYKNGGPYLSTPFFREEKVALRMFFAGPVPTGGLSAPLALLDASAYELIVAIGSIDGTQLATCNTFVWNGTDDCFEGVLNINTEEMNAALDASTGEISKVFEVQLYKDDEEFTFQQNVTVRNEVIRADGGLPTDNTETVVADAMEAILTQSNSVAWRRTGDDIYADVRRLTGGMVVENATGISVRPYFDAPTFFSQLSVALTGAGAPTYAATPTSHSAAATAGGQAGRRYLARCTVAITAEVAAYTGGEQKPGDATKFYRGTPTPTVPGDNYNRVTLAVSSPARTYVLNYAASSGGIETASYEADIEVDAGATLTLLIDSVDGQMLGLSQTCVVACVIAAELPLPHVLHRSSVAASAHTGNTTETTKATIAVPPLGKHSQLRLGVTYSRPATQTDDAFLTARLGGTLLWKQRVGVLRGGSVDVVILSNRNSQSSQLFAADSESDWLVGTGSINTAVATSLTIGVQLADAADSITLEAVTLTRENP